MAHTFRKVELNLQCTVMNYAEFEDLALSSEELTVLSGFCDHVQKGLVDVEDHKFETWEPVLQALRCAL